MNSQSPGVVKQRKLDVTANMECVEEELSEIQLQVYERKQKEYQDFLSKVESLIKHHGAEIKDQNDSVMVLQLPIGPPLPGSFNQGSKKTPTTRQGNALKQPLSLQGGLVSRSASSKAGGIIDPRLNLLADSSQSPYTAAGQGVPTVLPQNSTVKSNSPNINVRNLTPVGRGAASAIIPPKNINAVRPTLVTTASPNRVVRTRTVTTAGGTGKVNQNKAKGAVVDLTKESGGSGSRLRSYEPDSREINFNKLTGRTFPSLVVCARATLKIRELTPAMISSENTYLDGKLKQVLIHSATKFTEWLIQQGLVRSEQFCSTHINPDMTPVKLKLGMYSDVSKFPYSGGYVWISDCCPQRFVSVFSGSIFEGAPHAPSVLLKLMYHWSSQTNIQNVINWVKTVDNLYVKTFYTNLRAICTAAIHEKFEIFGGPNKKIEIGVISLGTTTTDGNNRQVKIEVLGIMDSESKTIRLRSVEPSLDGERNYKRRFAKILEPMEKWVHKESIILTDYTVDKSTLTAMGYTQVFQVPVNPNKEGPKTYSNVNVMEYLRRVVPRLFQNTLSLLSRQLIQQFLDEVVWREKWGYIPSKAFDQIINHLAEQTKLDTGDTLLARLQKIAANPFKDWAYDNWKANCNVTATDGANRLEKKVPVTETTQSQDKPSISKQQLRKRPATDAQQNSSGLNNSEKPVAPDSHLSVEDQKVVQGELVTINPYYYGTMAGDKDLLKQEVKRPLYMKCCICEAVLTTNIEILKHLANHVFNESARQKLGPKKSSMLQCRYCLSSFVTEVWLNCHIEETHKKQTPVLCLICNEKFKDRTTLILHLHRSHNELELPYACGICGFRCSQHTMVVDHFYDVHFNSEKVQCPFCLKIVSFADNGKSITQNLYFFLNHLLKHKGKITARKCERCVLWFVHYGLAKEHMSKDHCSFKNEPGVNRYPRVASEIMMPKPSVSHSAEKCMTHLEQITSLNNTYTFVKFPDMRINGVLEGSTCCECEGNFLEKEHFLGLFSCTKCQFKTCCRRAMLDHVSYSSHDPRDKNSYYSRRSKLEKEMHCVCGFKSVDADKLAEHLAKCGNGGRKSAYPSAERAEKCSAPVLYTTKPGPLSAREHKTKSEDGDSSMLGVLGLVRKPSSEESSSETMATSDVEMVSLESASELVTATGQSNLATNPNSENLQAKDTGNKTDVENEGNDQNGTDSDTEPMEIEDGAIGTENTDEASSKEGEASKEALNEKT